MEAVFKFFNEGLTVPFIVRYRHQEIGDIDGATAYSLNRDYQAYVSLTKVKQSRLEKFRQSSEYDADVARLMEECILIDDLDNIWDLYKESKSSKTKEAKSMPDVVETCNQLLNNKHYSIPYHISNEKLELIQCLLIENISHDIRNQTLIKEQCSNILRIKTILVPKPDSSNTNMTEFNNGTNKKKSKEKNEKKTINNHSKFADYNNFEKNVNDLISHQVSTNCIYYLTIYCMYIIIIF